ncbi:hypothetical protein QTP70_000148 [Hemibagrus guttatus]|uniref:NIDO domain-containing protein n=1 Tax=Hemibagrus guttatus TaxID=175788 RepID=A0AAE0QPX0_9TELE|nr:hypothetical protein QTP70_000148 [Hemibagrus guttatus]
MNDEECCLLQQLEIHQLQQQNQIHQLQQQNQVQPFFPVGPGATQLYLSDGQYQTIQLQQPFKYAGKTYTQFYLSMDGYVAFFVPNINDEVPNRYLGKDVIAPCGLIWMLTGASLQVVLASNGGDLSFVLMNYGSIPSIPPPYWLAGYDMEYSNFVTIPVNDTTELSSSTNVNIPGRWAFQFTDTSTTTAEPGSALFPVGPGATQLYLSDGQYQTIQLQQPFKYAGKTYTQFYLSMDGYVAFFVPNIDDEVPNRYLGKDVIAPLWTDLDADSGGRWTYEQATSGPLIDQANQEIRRTFPYVSFSASWVFVTTWENVPLEFSSFQGASLQVVLASNGGDLSFVLMNYGSIPSIPSPYWLAGYDMEYSNFVTIPVNDTTELSSSTNVNIPGRWAFQFTDTSTTTAEPAEYGRLRGFLRSKHHDEVPNRYLGKDVIAPLWTDLDADSGGRWTYEQATSGPLIDQANQEIRRTFPYVSFSASWVFVTTWENVPLEFSSFQGASLQVVLASNGGDLSFVLMNYGSIPSIPSPYWLIHQLQQQNQVQPCFQWDLERHNFISVMDNIKPFSFSNHSNTLEKHTLSSIFTFEAEYGRLRGFLRSNINDEVPNRYLSKDVIAPLWTDLDADSGGRWTYEQATSGPLIDQANQEIRRTFPYVSFSASWVFVTTWENVPLEFSSFQGASLQVVLASNGGDLSFVLMNYGSIPSIPSPYWLAGYDMEYSNFVTIPVNDTTELSSSTNVNIPGRWAFQFTAEYGRLRGFLRSKHHDEVPNRYLSKDVIAPLWTDLDADSGGRWTYEQATSGPLIDQANQEIRRTFPYVSFSASWVFVTTWENVPLEFSSFQGASLQVVLASNGGDLSFVLMNYGSIPSIPSPYWLAGYDMEYSNFVTIPVNDTTELSSSTNVNIPGRWAFQFTDTSTTTAEPGSALFPVGPGATQLYLSDGQYQTIQLQQPFKYAGKTYTQFYLSMDGYVAFFVPNINDEVPNRYLSKDVIAPLWTDLDADSGGRWTYEQATSGPLIDQANQEIRRTFPYVSFSASWVFVTTWENVPLEFSSFQGASLQVVLASNGGDLSFVLMNYGSIPSIPSPYWLLSMDGYVAFFVPNINDEVPNRYLSKDVIAPLWTDLDADSGGRWTYEQATSGPLIDQANQEIRRTFPYVSFSASWVFVTTWENVPLEFSSFQGASLQVVLASNGGDLSFVLMNYGSIPSIPSPYWLAGYDMEYSNFVTIPVNDTTELSSSTNVNIPGRWAFQFTDTSTTTAEPGSALFPVGPGATQLYLSDGQYQTIQLQQPFKYAGKTYTQFYLSMDGYVAFFVPNIDDEVPNRYLGKDVIAPLWTDLDADSGGRWTYEQATSGPLIDQANQEIRRTFPYVSFSASWVFVTTWENVPLEFSSFQGASLQVVLASNGGDLSFVLMNYGSIPSIPSPYWLAGYDMEYSNFVTIPVNDTTELSSSTNVNIPGRWAFQFTDTSTTTAEPGSALFPVGPGATQLYLSDGQYQTIQLQQPFKYAGKTYTQFYLSMDGYVAFFVPNINDEVPNRYLGKDVIAPLWTDLDADSGGRWTYEQATSGPLIDQANQEISRTFPYLFFSASWVFVATWENVPLEFSSFLGASLQVVLASNGGDLYFVLMNYGTIPSIPSPYWLPIKSSIKIEAKVLQSYYDRFTAYVEPKANVIFARYKFHEKMQGDHEPFEQFVTDLRLLVNDCNYANSDEMIRNCIVFGIHSPK